MKYLNSKVLLKLGEWLLDVSRDGAVCLTCGKLRVTTIRYKPICCKFILNDLYYFNGKTHNIYTLSE